MTTSLTLELYQEQKSKFWPKFGRHILAQFDEETVVVYQAFNPLIADFAVQNGCFGGPKYNFERMTWIKTNFLWMMYRSGWATKHNQERILAVYLTKEGFNDILRAAKEGKGVTGVQKTEPGRPDDVRLQWDPDHDPRGQSVERRAIQLGLRGNVLKKFHSDYIQRIEDITDFVNQQRQLIDEETLDKLLTPLERPYVPEDADLCRYIRLDGYDSSELNDTASSEGACCSDMLADTAISGNTDLPKIEVILCIGGAFNPVHTRHVQAMVEVKKWLEENTNHSVVAGRLAVAPDGYVKAKCRRTNEKCIKAEHRIAMCELACEGHAWLKPYNESTGSAAECGYKVRHEMGDDVTIAVVVGADRAVNKSGHSKWMKENRHLTICIGRKGDTEHAREALAKDKQAGRVKDARFYIVPMELENVSSTEVRKKLALIKPDISDKEGNDNIVGDIVKLGWINDKEGAYILENISDLYE